MRMFCLTTVSRKEMKISTGKDGSYRATKLQVRPSRSAVSHVATDWKKTCSWPHTLPPAHISRRVRMSATSRRRPRTWRWPRSFRISSRTFRAGSRRGSTSAGAIVQRGPLPVRIGRIALPKSAEDRADTSKRDSRSQLHGGAYLSSCWEAPSRLSRSLPCRLILTSCAPAASPLCIATARACASLQLGDGILDAILVAIQVITQTQLEADYQKQAREASAGR